MPRKPKNAAAISIPDANLSIAPVSLRIADEPSLLPIEADEQEELEEPKSQGRISQPPTRAKKAGAPRAPEPHADQSGSQQAQRRKTRKNTKAAPRPVQESIPPVVKRRELLGLFLVALGVLCVMALWSYRPNDGPWALPKRPTHNWVGPAGAMVADGLVFAFGLGSHLLAMGLIIVGGLCFSRRPPAPSGMQFVGSMVTLMCGAIISHLALKGTGAVPYAPGGLLGTLCGDGLARLFSAPGTAVIAGAGFASGLVICTDLSMSRMLRGVLGLFTHVGDKAKELWEIRLEKRRIRQELEAQALLALAQQTQQETAQEAEDRAEREEKRKISARIKAERAIEKEQRDADMRAREALAALVTMPPEELAPEPMIVIAPVQQEPVVAPAPALPEVIIALPAPDAPAPVALVTTSQETPAAPGEEPRIVEFVPRNKKEMAKLSDPKDERPRPYGQAFELPPLNLLDYQAEEEVELDREALNENARILTRTFKDFGIDGHVREIRPGPVVTTYEFTPAAGIRVGKIAGMADDLAMALEAMSVRIVAPIPGKNAVGIEIPNTRRQNVYLKEIIAHPDFQRARSKLALALGKDIEGKPVQADLAKMPHVLIAGTTGSGKSVSVNGMILSILYKATPDEVRMLMIDPKMLELKLYDGIPHLLLPPVTDPKKAALALRWAVEEMERRYQLLADFSVRDITTFNKKMERFQDEQNKKIQRNKDAEDAELVADAAPVVTMDEAGATVDEEASDTQESDERALAKTDGKIPDKLPYIVVVVDEFADLMMVASKDVETYVARLAQKARACGIHVMLATQRPSVDVITGVIKANFPTRMSFKVASSHDSKTIINTIGANRLLGNGDMLMIPPGSSDLMRVHGGFVTETEIARVVNFWKAQGKPQYNEAILRPPESEADSSGPGNDEPYDEFFDQAVDIVARTRKVSISEIQRKLGVGYNRAAKMVERMEKDGLIGPNPGANKPREVYVRNPDE